MTKGELRDASKELSDRADKAAQAARLDPMWNRLARATSNDAENTPVVMSGITPSADFDLNSDELIKLLQTMAVDDRTITAECRKAKPY